MPIEPLVQQVALAAAVAAELGAALVIVIAMLEAAGRVVFAFSGELRPDRQAADALDKKEQIRLRFARWLALALEFLLAADILRTAVAPTWEEIGQLAAVAALRTALNFFLQREIDSAERRRANSTA